MKFDIKMYPSAIKKLTKAQITAAHMTAEQMRTEIINEQVIPFDEGTLQNVQTYIDPTNPGLTKDGTVKIAHDTPYATRLYFHPEYNFQRTFNQLAKGEWWEDWITGLKRNRPMKLFKHYYNKITGG